MFAEYNYFIQKLIERTQRFEQFYEIIKNNGWKQKFQRKIPSNKNRNCFLILCKIFTEKFLWIIREANKRRGHLLMNNLIIVTLLLVLTKCEIQNLYSFLHNERFWWIRKEEKTSSVLLMIPRSVFCLYKQSGNNWNFGHVFLCIFLANMNCGKIQNIVWKSTKMNLKFENSCQPEQNNRLVRQILVHSMGVIIPCS